MESISKRDPQQQKAVASKWEADLPIFDAHGRTDVRALFSIGQPSAKRRTVPALTAQAAGIPLVRRPRTSVIIFATPRSGSYLLCESLIQTNLAGRPTEYFGRVISDELIRLWHAANYASYVEKVLQIGTTSNGVFGAKICWTEMAGFMTNLKRIPTYRHLSGYELLSTAFPDLRPVWIRRRDKVQQAISYWRAHVAREWMRFKDERDTPYIPTFDFQAIESLRQSIESYEEEMQTFFTQRNIEPFIVFYEDLVAAYRKTTLQVLDYVRIAYPEDLSLPEPVIQKQADAISDEWMQRYCRLKQE